MSRVEIEEGSRLNCPACSHLLFEATRDLVSGEPGLMEEQIQQYREKPLVYGDLITCDKCGVMLENSYTLHGSNWIKKSQTQC